MAEQKTNKFIFGILMLFGIMLLATGFATAERYVNYSFYEATILGDGTFVPGTNPVTGVNALGYVCLDATCSQLGSQVAGLTGNSADNNWMVLTFPTSLQSSYGYGIYFYKDGYIVWEQSANWWGTQSGESPTNPAQTSPKYLTKKENCIANIFGIAVLNEVEMNKPLIINVTAEIDAAVASAFQSSGPLEAIPPTIEQYYTAETTITATIYNSANQIVYQNSTAVDILVDDFAFVQFEWIPEIEGNYRIVVTAEVTDAKCLSYQITQNEAQVAVLAEQPYNMCYTLLNLSFLPPSPNVNDTVNISVWKISNAADSNGNLSTLETDLALQILNQKTGETVLYNFSTAPANSNINDFEQYSWQWVPGEEGWYTVYVRGIANSCPYSENTFEMLTTEIYVNGTPINHAPVITSKPEIEAVGGVRYKYQLKAYDPDGDVLTYSLIEAPCGMKISSTTGLIEWTPSEARAGKKYNVRIKVSDGQASAEQSYELEVVPKPAPVEEPLAEEVPVIKDIILEAGVPEARKFDWPTFTLITFDIVLVILLILMIKLILAALKH